MNNNKTADAFGHALMDYYKGIQGAAVIERDDGHIEPEGETVYFSEYKVWPEMEKAVLKYVTGRVLDVGCGAGRHSLYLQKKGFDVTGIDVSPLAVSVCRLRGLRKARLLSIGQIDEFKSDSFDSVIMMCNNFGLFGRFSKVKTLLKKFHRITSKDAVIIAQTLDPYMTKSPEHVCYQKFNLKRGRKPGEIRLRVRYKKFIGRWFNYLFVSQAELKQLLENTGWGIKKIIDSGSPRYMVILAKSSTIDTNNGNRNGSTASPS